MKKAMDWYQNLPPGQKLVLGLAMLYIGVALMMVPGV